MNHRTRSYRRNRNFRPGAMRWYRIPSEGMLTGICAGLAEYYGVTTLVSRGLMVTAGLFIPQVVVIAYIIGIFVLPTRAEVNAAADERERILMGETEFDDEIDMAATNRSQSYDRRKRKEKRKDRKKRQEKDTKEFERDQRATDQAMDRRRIMIRRYKESLGHMEGRLQNLERHVTSKRYDLAREIDRL